MLSKEPKQQEIPQAEKPEGGQCTYYNIKDHPIHLYSSLWEGKVIRSIFRILYFIEFEKENFCIAGAVAPFAFFLTIWYIKM